MPDQSRDRGLVIRVGPLSVDVPRSIGYFGGIGLAVAVGVLEPPLAVFLAAVPVVKMLTNPAAPQPLRFLGEVFEGAAQPVGGEAEGTIRLENAPAARIAERTGIRAA